MPITGLKARPGGIAADFRAGAARAGIGPERTKLVIVCNPNNPTGTSVGAEAFDRFAASLPPDVVLVVDEAYAEFARRPDFPDSFACVARGPGTILLRSFSNCHSMNLL